MNIKIPASVQTFASKEAAVWAAIPLRSKILGGIVLVSLLLNVLFFTSSVKSKEQVKLESKVYHDELTALDEKIAEAQQHEAALQDVIGHLHQDIALHERRDSLLLLQQTSTISQHQQTQKQYEKIKDRYRTDNVDSLLRALDQ